MSNAHKTVLVFHSCVRSSWQEMLGGIRSFAQSRRWRLQVVEHVPPRKAIGELLGFWRPDGVIVEAGMDAGGTFTGDLFGRLPVVYLFGDAHRLKPKALHVDCDVDALGALAAREFLTLGAKSFVFFGFRDIFWSESRGTAFERALALNGCHAEILSQRFVESGRGGGSADTRSLDRLIRCLRDLPKPCGVFAANDMLADEVLGLCQACGLKVPADVAVLGVDDDESVCEHTNPTLSSLRPDFFGAGFASAEMLEERLRKKGRMPSVCRRTISSVQLVRRGSTRLLPRSNADISKALELIRRQACDGLRPRDVFAQMAVSSRLVEMRFRELTGHTVAEEIRLARLDFAKRLLPYDNLIYTVHVYQPMGFTHQGLFQKKEDYKPKAYPSANAKADPNRKRYPGDLGKDTGKAEVWDKEFVRREIQSVRDFQLRHGVRIFVGEFSAAAYAPGGDEYINDLCDLFLEYGWDWTYHAFRESTCWSFEHEGSSFYELKKAGKKTRRQEILEKYMRDNR